MPSWVRHCEVGMGDTSPLVSTGWPIAGTGVAAATAGAAAVTAGTTSDNPASPPAATTGTTRVVSRASADRPRDGTRPSGVSRRACFRENTVNSAPLHDGWHPDG